MAKVDIDGILGRLQRVRRSGTGWQACCPAHDDRAPSLSISVGADGRVLLHCHAGCRYEDVAAVLGIPGHADSEATATPSAPPGIDPACAVPAVAQWLAETRGLSNSEIERICAHTGRRGHAVAFAYRRENGAVLYYKCRALDEKRFWRHPAGSASVLYGLETLGQFDRSRVAIVEGELDAHALRAAGLNLPVVSVPDGAGSRVASRLVAPLAGFAEVFIATDGDEPGESLAQRLGAALGPKRCRRVRFARDSRTYKDANEALLAGWEAADFDAAFKGATALAVSGVDGCASHGQPYRVLDGEMVRVTRDRDGDESVDRLANFVARITDEITLDDGAEQTLTFRIRGTRSDGTEFRQAMVPATEFNSLAWVTNNWGARAVMYAGSGRKDHIRAAIPLLSEPARRAVYAHTGWRRFGETWAYLHQGGAIGCEDIEVKLDPSLDRFALPTTAVDPEEAVRLSLSLLDCGPPAIMIPLVGSIYAAPLSFSLNPDFVVWLVGATGSLKSELAALAQRHFGDFDRKSLPGSWSSTANALESLLWAAKDMLVVVDDFAPQGDSQALKEQTKRAELVLRNIGNRTGKGRLRADLTQRPVRAPRGLTLSTGEDHPATRSIIARLVLVHVDRDTLDLGAIARLQTSGDRLRHAMRAYLGWLQPQIPTLERILPTEHAALVANDFSARTLGPHLRASGGVATLYQGLDLFLQFAQSLGVVTEDCARARLAEAADVLRSLARRQGELLQDNDPAARFVQVLTTLLGQRKVCLRHRKGELPSMGGGDELLGWFDRSFGYLLPDAVQRAVKLFQRDIGEGGEGSTARLYETLIKRGIILPGPGGKPTTQLRFDQGRERVLVLPLDVLHGQDGGVTDPVTGGSSQAAAEQDMAAATDVQGSCGLGSSAEAPSRSSQLFDGSKR